jgi:putative SOS response-associated peptidase YedK
MCDRYVLPDQPAAEREFLPALNWWNFAARFNVSAQQYIPTLRWHDSQSEAAAMLWGLVPARAEGRPTTTPPIRVQRDEILDSTTFRSPWLKRFDAIAGECRSRYGRHSTASGLSKMVARHTRRSEGHAYPL